MSDIAFIGVRDGSAGEQGPSLGLFQARADRSLPADPEVAASLLTLEVIADEQALAGVGAEWDELYARTGCGVPFLSHQWMRAWWRVCGRASFPLSRRLHVVLLRLHGHLVGVAPFEVTSVGRLFRFVRMLGSDGNLTEVRALLVEPNWELAAYERLRRHFTDEFTSWNLLHWTGIPARWEALRPMLAFAHAEDALYTPLFALPLAADEAEFRGRLKRNIKESLRHCYNSLKRAGIEFEFRMLHGAAEIGGFLPDFYLLHGSRAQHQEGVVHPNYFSNARHRALLEAEVRALDERCYCGVISVAGRPVAARLAFLQNGQMYFYYSGFDVDYGKYSIMTTTLMESFKYAMKQGVRTALLAVGRDVSKERWGPEEIGLVDLFCCGRGALSKLVYGRYRRRRIVTSRKESLAAALPGVSEEPVDVSVIIQARGREEDLRETRNSVARQRDVKVEVVVIDDGAAPAADLSVAALGAPEAGVARRDRVVATSLAPQRNKVLPRVRGERILFLDEGDVLDDGALAALCEARGEGTPTGRLARIQRRLEALGRRFSVVARLLGGADGTSLSPIAVPRSVALSVGGFDERMSVGDDVEFLLRCVRRAGLEHVTRLPLAQTSSHRGPRLADAPPPERAEALRHMREAYAARHGRLELIALAAWARWTALRATPTTALVE